MNNGFINEQELKDYINKYSYDTYNTNIQNFLNFTFKENLNTNFPFEAEKQGGQAKPDLCIKHNGIKKYISIKKGNGNSVHQEQILVFFPYIQNILGTNYLNILKKYHYGDDTENDTGITRYNATECKIKYASDISILNEKLNNWSFLPIFLDRFLFTGNVGTTSAEIIYHGTINDGLWANRDEIMQYIKKNNFDINAVHFGPLTYQVWGRNEKRTAKHPERRYIMQIKWGTISNDIKNIRKEF